MADIVTTASRRETRGATLLVSLSVGHVGIHWFQQLWPVIIPSVKASLGISDTQLGTLSSVRQFGTASMMLPSGMLADLFRERTALILASAFLFMGVSYLLVAQAHTFLWMLPAMALVGVGTALWHPAAMGSISLRFRERRGSALAVHGVGASIGDTVSPVVIGLVLLSLAWRRFLELNAIPALVIGVILWRSLGSAYRDQTGIRPSLISYLLDARDLARHRVVMAVIAVNVLTGMARLSIITFLPVYIQDDLGYSALGLGFFWGVLHAMGTFSQPAMGYLSDRFGRKTVLLPSLVIFGLLYLGLAEAAPGLQLILVVGALGLFFYALTTLTLATIMDVATDRVQSSTVGISSLVSQLLSFPSPIIAGLLVSRFGTESAFLFAGAVTLLAAALLVPIRIPRSTRPAPRAAG